MKNKKHLDIEKLNNGFEKIVIGELTDDVITMLKLNRQKDDIILWGDRYKYINKHIDDFKSKENFERCISAIPEVIANPDYIAKHPTKESVEYIKQLDELFIVAVRIKPKGKLAFRTAYPLTQKQLSNYIASGTAIKV